MMSRTLKALLVCCAFALAASGCATRRGELSTPDGFAHYQDRELYTVISPQAVSMRVRTAENEPQQSLEFWAQTLERHLSGAGYALLEKGSFETATGAGIRHEWVAPVGEEDWVYLTAISVNGPTVIIVEAAGPYQHYQEHRRAVVDSLSTLKLAKR